MGAIRTLPFWGVHVAAGAGVWALGWSWAGFLLAVALYYVRMFFLAAGWHRYFAHRAYKTSRAFQFLLALGGTLCVQKGVLWWAANHRIHHKFADEPGDIHSPRQGGFWWSHAGWFLSGVHRHTAWERIGDLARYPELRWISRYYLVPVIAFALATWAIGGMWALVWGFFVSTTILWHGTFTINSLAHLVGSRRYDTRDDSKNHLGLALLTLGEGWHNNHHHYQRAVNQGFRWWEIDIAYYLLCVLSWVGLISDLKRPPPHVLAGAASASTSSESTPLPTSSPGAPGRPSPGRVP